MQFTTEGLQKQREDLYESIASLQVLSTTNEVLYTANKEDFEQILEEVPEGTLMFKVETTGVHIGPGNTVKGFRLLGEGEVIYYENIFDEPNTCITELDTFNFIFSLGH